MGQAAFLPGAHPKREKLSLPRNNKNQIFITDLGKIFPCGSDRDSLAVEHWGWGQTPGMPMGLWWQGLAGGLGSGRSEGDVGARGTRIRLGREDKGAIHRCSQGPVLAPTAKFASEAKPGLS